MQRWRQVTTRGLFNLFLRDLTCAAWGIDPNSLSSEASGQGREYEERV